MGLKPDIPSTTSTTVGSQSHSQFTSPLCTPLSFSNLSNFTNILEDFNVNQRQKFNSTVAIWPQPLITLNEELKNSHAESDKRSAQPSIIYPAVAINRYLGERLFDSNHGPVKMPPLNKRKTPLNSSGNWKMQQASHIILAPLLFQLTSVSKRAVLDPTFTRENTTFLNGKPTEMEGL